MNIRFVRLLWWSPILTVIVECKLDDISKTEQYLGMISNRKKKNEVRTSPKHTCHQKMNRVYIKSVTLSETIFKMLYTECPFSPFFTL